MFLAGEAFSKVIHQFVVGVFFFFLCCPYWISLLVFSLRALSLAISYLVRGGRGDIPRLSFACSPDADKIKVPEEAGKDDIEVEFQNIEQYLGTPASCKIYLTKCGNDDKPSLFWRLYAGGTLTSSENTKDTSEWSSKEDAANLQLWKIKIPVTFTGALMGPSARDGAAVQLKHHVQPDTCVNVLLPLLVNHRDIDAKHELVFHRVAPVAPQKEKRPPPAAHPLDAWKAQKVAHAKAAASSK